jgi:pectate lyase
VTMRSKSRTLRRVLFAVLFAAVGCWPLSCGDGGTPSQLDGQVAPDGDATPVDGSTPADGTTPLPDGGPTEDSGVPPGPALAFVGAEGWGRDATGGRGGEVRKVTNLDDSGPGSFRDAVETAGAAYVVFEVAGTINLLSRVDLSSDKTIAGETAFVNGGEGITLKINQGTTTNTLVAISDSSNVICRYLRFRRGPGLAPEVDGDSLLLVGTGTDFMFDHCSFSWSTDELVNPYGPTTMTFQSCIFSEALFNSTHAYTTDPNHSAYPSPHSMGPLIGNGSSQVTFYNSLFAHNNQRNPLVGGGVQGGSEYELVNNVVYNYGYFGTQFGFDGTPVQVNLINNLHIQGIETATVRYGITIIDGVTAYARGNINDKRASASDPEWDAIGCSSGCGTYMQEPAPTAWQSLTPFNFPLQAAPAMTSTQVSDGVLNHAGASLSRDAVDTRIVDDVRNGTGGFIDDPGEVGGWPTLSGMTTVPMDSDDDGMEDSWETLTYGSLGTGANDDTDGDGYTNLEEYLHHLAAGG